TYDRDAEIIDKMITKFRMSVIEDDNANQEYGHHLVTMSTSSYRQKMNRWKDVGYELYKLVFYPLSSAVGGCKRLIAPDGDLTRLPFEVLPLDKDGRKLLIDDYSISYLTTALDILRITKYFGDLLQESHVVADPDFDLVSSSSGGICTPPEKMEIGRQSRD